MKAKVTSPPPGPTAADKATHSPLTILVQKLQAQLKLGPPVKDPVKFVVSARSCLDVYLLWVQGWLGGGCGNEWMNGHGARYCWYVGAGWTGQRE